MDTRKITLIATIAAIALVAVGIGYAYTATTTNTGNSVATEYVVITQDAYSFGSANVQFTTSNSGGTITYTLENATNLTVTTANDYKGVALSRSGPTTESTLTITQTGGTPVATKKVIVWYSDFTLNTESATDWKLVLGYVPTTQKTTAANWNYVVLGNAENNAAVLSLANGTEYTTTLFYATEGGDANSMPPATVATNGVITFKYNSEDAAPTS